MPKQQAPEADAFARAQQLQDDYLAYLRDALPLDPAHARLRTLYDRQIDRPGGFVTPPLLSVNPRFEVDKTLRQLVAEGVLNRSMLGLDPGRFPPDRPLYRHQCDAIRRIAHGDNTVVATGTGSGKTECFLLPVLDDAFSHPDSGVKTLLIYPMNALANDQLKRLREIVGDSGIRFGRYTGETVETDEECDPLPSAEQCPSELRSREAIRRTPPQILLTNFAMLEYLLLRPDDRSIFAANTLTTVVLDEAHAYDGVQGIDVGLLMRRLQQRSQNRLKFVLTSATLGTPGPEGDRAVAEFAHRLTGGGFAPDAVIRGTTRRLSPDEPGGCTWTPDLEEAAAAAAAPPQADRQQHGQAAAFTRACREAGFDSAAAALQCDPLTLAILNQLTQHPATVAELASQLEQPPQRVADRLSLVLSDQARGGALPAVRMHQFFRGLHGASVTLRVPPDAATEPDACIDQVRLEQAVMEADDDGPPWLPLVCCSACGLPAVELELQEHQSRCRPRTAQTLPDQVRLLTWVGADSLAADQDADEEKDQADDLAGFNASRVWLGSEDCRYYVSEPGAQAKAVPLLRLTTDDRGNVNRCPRCGGSARPFPTIFRTFRTGEDAPTAVLAEAMLRAMPDPGLVQPAGGRQLLSFSDSRQKAAFFAPYFNRTVRDAAEVQPLVEAAGQLDADGEGALAADVIDRAVRIATRRPFVVMPQDDGVQKLLPSDDLGRKHKGELRTQTTRILLRHLCSRPSQRLRLPALCLAGAGFDIVPAERRHFDQVMSPLLPDAATRHHLLQATLLVMLQRVAVDLPDGLLVKHILAIDPGPQAAGFHLSQSGDADGVQTVRFNAFEAPARSRKRAVRASRIIPLLRAAAGLSSDHELADATSRLWDALRRPGAGDDALLTAGPGPGMFRVNFDRLLVHASGPWHVCQRCNSVTRYPLGPRCLAAGCGGDLAVADHNEVARGRASRLRSRYSDPPMLADAAEHTAQLTHARGREVQARFLAGRINVLSCSTTFEMGIDVGDLDAVLLRNVPPTPANYVQRVGRAGRRHQAASHAVVYAPAHPTTSTTTTARQTSRPAVSTSRGSTCKTASCSNDTSTATCSDDSGNRQTCPPTSRRCMSPTHRGPDSCPSPARTKIRTPTPSAAGCRIRSPLCGKRSTPSPPHLSAAPRRSFSRPRRTGCCRPRTRPRIRLREKTSRRPAMCAKAVSGPAWPHGRSSSRN